MRFLIAMIIYIFSVTIFMLIALVSQFLQMKKQNNFKNNNFLNIFNFKFMKKMFFLLIKGNNVKERKKLLQLEFMKEKETYVFKQTYEEKGHVIEGNNYSLSGLATVMICSVVTISASQLSEVGHSQNLSFKTVKRISNTNYTLVSKNNLKESIWK